MPQLHRSLGLWQLTVTGVGIIIGAGIYVLIGAAAEKAGGLLWLSFTVGALLAALTGLSYAELATLFPNAGAEYEFARRAFNEFTGFISGWMMAAANIIGGATVSIGFAFYLQRFFDVPTAWGALGMLTVLTVIVSAGVHRSIWLSTALVALQVGGLLLVIAAGAPHLGTHSLTENASFPGVLAGAALVFFAFIGFDEVVTLSEETHDPAHTVPRALWLSLGLSTLLYVAVGIVAVSSVGIDALAQSDRPLALVLEQDLGVRGADVIAIIALAATANTTLLLLTTSTRLLFAMSRGGALPLYLSRLSSRGHAPWVAAIATLVVAAPFALSGRITLVAEVTNFAIYAIFLVVNASLIRLRFLLPDAPREFRVPLAVAGFSVPALLAIATTILMMTYLARSAWILGGLMVLSGLGAWLIGPYLGRRAQRAPRDQPGPQGP